MKGRTFLETKVFALKGDILYSTDPNRIETHANSVVVCNGGLTEGVFKELPAKFAGARLFDFTGRLIIPGMNDLHIHAPQFAFRGLGADLELLDWLDTFAFPEEKKYIDPNYAKTAYELFAKDLKLGATTRAAVFATIHMPATLLLMELLEETNLITCVGKVNMDRNAIDGLQEADAAASLAATREWLAECHAHDFKRTGPILTPRFIPSCSPELMRGLGELHRDDRLPLQSHLSENTSEIAWVRELCPDAAFYADAYLRYGTLGGEGLRCIMAHCVHSGAQERALLKRQGVWMAHCPESNTCLGSGIAPVREFLDEGGNAGLGTDVAGGFSSSMFHTIAETVKVSKLRRPLADESSGSPGSPQSPGSPGSPKSPRPVTFEEAFWLATAGGGSFFGKVGKFEKGYEFDALVLDESAAPHPQPLSARDRLERTVYLDHDHSVIVKYVGGKRI
ncbi:MAG: amidohydrolase family protein [Clostridiales Family XIII bacterium]|jgi:guanine deaminase|nr:amidohydrolase family protein [Clostridiales Family XIII bacterium]